MRQLSALVMPELTAPRRSSLRRQLLFFDRVLIVDPSDEALLNAGEVRERFPNGLEISWDKRTPFPRSPDFTESMRELASELAPLRRDGLVDLVQPGPHRLMDSGGTWVAYSAAIANEQLVTRVASHVSLSDAKRVLRDGFYTGGVMAAQGYPSRYDVATKAATPTGIEEERLMYAYARIGQSLKTIRRAFAENACPVALDAESTEVLMALGGASFSTAPTTDELAGFAIAVDVVDPTSLDQVLLNASWPEILRIRREILPYVKRLREALGKRVTKLHRSKQQDMNLYRTEFAAMKVEYDKLKGDLSLKWSEFGVASVLKGGAAAGLAAKGLATFVPPTSVGELIRDLLLGVLAVGAAVSAEVRAVLPLRSKLSQHPLFFFEDLPGTIAKKL